MTSVTVIGLGAMGLGMARSLLRAGVAVRGCDLRAEARATLAAAGGSPAETAAEAAQDAEIVVVTVVNAAQAEAVLLGPQGALTAMAPGGVVVLSSTVPAADARALAAKVAAEGRLFLDAPMSGGTIAAEEGRLTFMASGAPAAFAAAEPAMGAMAGTVYRLGDEPGIGSTVKSVNQLLAGVHIAAAAEAMAFGVRAGADPRTLYEVITNSAGNSWMFANRVPHMLDGDYTPRSAVEIFVKDLGLVLDAGRSLRFPLPLAAAAHQLFLMAAAAGLGQADDAAVVKVFERLTGIEVSRPDRTS
ncbi:MAG: L-threonate dehydrogenase [Geminicoccaceae bacterium]